MLNKKKTGIIVLGLAALSLGTIGFSSWIINAINGKADSVVNVIVGDVVDKSLTIDSVNTTDPDLNFDVAPNTDGGGVIQAGSDGKDEDLSFGFSFDLWGPSQAIFEAATSDKEFKVSFASDELSDLVESKAICSPITIDGNKHPEDAITTFAATTTNQTDNYETGEGNTSAVRLEYSMTKIGSTGKYGFTVSMTYSFTWGEAFDFNNPVKLTAIDDDAKTALDALKALNEQNSMKLNVSLSLETIA